MVDLVRSKREQTLQLARQHGVTRVRLFGSMARGDAGSQRDVDLLVPGYHTLALQSVDDRVHARSPKQVLAGLK